MSAPSDAPRGYLAALVERVLPSVPALQRRQPALFEPAPPRAGAGLHEAATELVTEAPAARMRADAPDMMPAAAVHERPAPPYPEPPPQRHDLAADAPSPQRAALPVVPEVVIRRETTTLVREPPQVDASVRATPLVMPPIVRVPAVVPASTPMPAPATAAPATAAALPPQARPVPSAVPLPPEPARRAAPARGDAPPLRRAHDAVASPALPASRPQASPALPARAAFRAAVQAALRQNGPPPPRELPPVEVTIGRVEVRVVAAPPGASRSTRTAPRLSLEQYLSERSGGRR